MPVNHIVLFRFKDDASPDAIEQVSIHPYVYQKWLTRCFLRPLVECSGWRRTASILKPRNPTSGLWQEARTSPTRAFRQANPILILGISPNRITQNGIQWGFVAEFDSLEDRDFYVSTDEAHQAFIASVGTIVEKVIVVDYSFWWSLTLAETNYWVSKWSPSR